MRKLKAQIETDEVTRVIDAITEQDLLAELDALPTTLADSSAYIVLSSLDSPDDILGIRRLAADRWLVTPVPMQPQLIPGADELGTDQVRELVRLFYEDGNWQSLLRTQ